MAEIPSTQAVAITVQCSNQLPNHPVRSPVQEAASCLQRLGAKVPCHFTSIPTPKPSKQSCLAPRVSILQGHSTTPSGRACKNSTPRNGHLRHNAKGPPAEFSHSAKPQEQIIFPAFFFFFKEPAQLGILKVLPHYCKIQRGGEPSRGRNPGPSSL